MGCRPRKYSLNMPDILATRFDKILTPENSGLELMSIGRFQIARNQRIVLPKNLEEETALFCVKGQTLVEAEDGFVERLVLGEYDTLYIPAGRSYRVGNVGNAKAELIFASAQSKTEYPTALIKFEEAKKDATGELFMKLKGGREVFMLLNLDTPASKLQLGLTIFHPNAYSFPIHNHDDQEEVYVFLKGRGRMEVYLNDEEKEFEEQVREGDLVTIPFGYYHPVYNSEEGELHFLYLLAGARYRIGDRVSFPRE